MEPGEGEVTNVLEHCGITKGLKTNVSLPSIPECRNILNFYYVLVRFQPVIVSEKQIENLFVSNLLN